MKVVNKLFSLFNLRTHRWSFNTFTHYFINMFFPQEIARIRGDLKTYVILGIIILFYPKLLILVIVTMFFVSNQEAANNEIHELHADYDSAVSLILLKHHYQLTELLKERPELLDFSYKNKTLTFWCKHYKNHEAHNIIVGLKKQKLKS